MKKINAIMVLTILLVSISGCAGNDGLKTQYLGDNDRPFFAYFTVDYKDNQIWGYRTVTDAKIAIKRYIQQSGYVDIAINLKSQKGLYMNVDVYETRGRNRRINGHDVKIQVYKDGVEVKEYSETTKIGFFSSKVQHSKEFKDFFAKVLADLHENQII